MSLALRISAPCYISHRQPRRLGFVFPLWSCRTNLRCTSVRGIRCSTADADETSGQDGPRQSSAESHSPSWAHVEPAKETYAGWAPVDSDSDSGRLPGLLQIGAGIALALVFSLVTYTAFSRKGTKNAVVYSVTTQQQAELPSVSNIDDAHKPLDSGTSNEPSATEGKQQVYGENPQPDLASAPYLLQKKTAPGQESFLSQDVTEFSDEDNVLSTETFTDSDLESNEGYDASDSENADSKPSSAGKELSIDEGFNPESDEKDTDVLSTDDNFTVYPISLSPALDVARPSPDRSDTHESPSESTSEINVLEKENEKSGDFSLVNSGNVQLIDGPEESSFAGGNLDGDPQAKLTEEIMIIVSALPIVPSGAVDEVIETLGENAASKLGELDLIASKPGHVNIISPSVIETPSSPLGSEFWHSESVESFGIPAPSTPSAAAQATPSNITVPATIDPEQEQAFAALQALKVIELGVEAGGICTRREYARWLIAITSTLARSPAQKVFPAMYIDTVSELAFNDVVPEDPDYPYIQGLAEAGLISSNLSRHDADENGCSTDGAIFLPDSPLSRQDLVTWRVALEGHAVQTVDKQKLKAQTGYIDFDRINEDALPFIAVDLALGDRSIISTAFGYTRRLQPGKPVTRAQAAVALVTGEAADIVAEELTRIEAEDIAEAAVVAELALEVRAHKHVDEYFNTELKHEKDLRLSVEKQLEELKVNLEKSLAERKNERISLDSTQAAVQAERDLLYRFRQDVEEQLQALTVHKMGVLIEKEKLETLRKEAEEGGQALETVKAEMEVEKKALILARLWAEDEAKKARAHAKVLEEVRKRWEVQGIQVRVDKELEDDNIPALGWHYSGPKTELNKFLQRPPVQDLLVKAGDLKSRIVLRFAQLLQAAGRVFTTLQQKTSESFQVVGEKTGETFRTIGEKTSESVRAAREKTGGSFRAAGEKMGDSVRVVGEKAHGLQEDTVSAATKKMQEMQGAARSTLAGVSSSVTEGSRRIADGFRGEARKLVGRFRS